MGYRLRLSSTALIIAFGSSLQIGYFSVVYNVPQDVVESYVNESFGRLWNYTLVHSDLTWMWSSIVSLNLLGKLISCLFVPFFADRFGRKNSLIAWTIPAVVSVALQYAAYPTDLYYLLAAGRFLHGMYGGFVGVLVPLFFAEIAGTPRWRSALSRIHNVVTVFGSVLAFLLGLPQLLGTPDRWAYLPAIPLVFVVIAVCWLSLVPESPLHLIGKGRCERNILESVRYYNGSKRFIEDQAKTLTRDTDSHRSSTENGCEKSSSSSSSSSPAPPPRFAIVQLLRQNRGRRQAFLWFNLAVVASFAGGSLAQNYSTAMMSGFHGFSLFAKYATVVTSVVRLLIVVGVMHAIDRLGRRRLLLFCSYATLFCYLLLTLLAVFSDRFEEQLLVYVRLPVFLIWTGASYGVFSTASLIVAESAGQTVRATGLALYKIVFYLGGVLLTVSYPHYAEIREEYGYLLVGCPFLISLIYVTATCPETKNVNLMRLNSAVETENV